MSRTKRTPCEKRNRSGQNCDRNTCDYCASNRTIQHKRALMAAAERALDALMPEMARAVVVAQAQVERAQVEQPYSRCPVWDCPIPTVPHVHRDRFGIVAFEVREQRKVTP